LERGLAAGVCTENMILMICCESPNGRASYVAAVL
jgi:hypothetical protein